MNKRFKIAEIAFEIKEDGTPMYWCMNYGMHPGQGGMEFVYGNCGTDDLDSTLKILSSNLLRDQQILLDTLHARIKELEEREDKDKS